MNNNDVLRRLRFALDLSDEEVRRLCRLASLEVELPELWSYLIREGDPGFEPCPDAVIDAMLDGYILHRRGPRDPAAPARSGPVHLDNNNILRKLRIALELKEPDMLSILQQGGMDVSPSELGALFRNKNNSHYRACGDQLLRNFLKGLTVRLRGVGATEP